MCLNAVRTGWRRDAIDGGADVQALVLLDFGARCMTAQGVDAIQGEDLIRYAHIKCCVQYLKKSMPAPMLSATAEPSAFVFPVREYHRCVTAVRSHFSRNSGEPRIKAAIALLYEGSRCTARIGLDRIAPEDVRRLTGGSPAPLARQSL
jgi:hypothetical protein